MREDISNKSTLNTTKGNNKQMIEEPLIKGYVTVIKNVGRPDEQVLCLNKPNLLTNGGRDWMIAQVYTNTSAGTRGSGFIALTSNTGAPAAGDTALASEITTGGLARADATTKSHTGGTNSTTIQHTFTASATHTAVQKSGLFNASSGVTLSHENTFTAVTLQSSDTLQVTWTTTLG
jgi:hypothetical protein|tara:strand:- start:376 stop:906 length:531 start_codon:yes stop_codon:yes gene_type:complete